MSEHLICLHHITSVAALHVYLYRLEMQVCIYVPVCVCLRSCVRVCVCLCLYEFSAAIRTVDNTASQPESQPARESTGQRVNQLRVSKHEVQPA